MLTLGNYQIVSLIGQGGYGQIYQAIDTITGAKYALKLERVGERKQSLRHEFDIIHHLDSPHFPEVFSYGETLNHRYVVMELCGLPLSSVRRALGPTASFSLCTTLRAAVYMLRAIECCHKQGVLHRDVKPANFLLRQDAQCPLVLIDFGLSRPFINPANGQIIRPRDNPGFVGTSKYASLNAHMGKELGRRDDLISWLFIVVEMARGFLPWGKSDMRDQIFTIKASISFSTFLKGLPRALKDIWKMIRKLSRLEEPDYELITAFLCQALDEVNGKWDEPYDWERIDLSETSPIPLVMQRDETMQWPQALTPGMVIQNRRRARVRRGT
jgi:serine/threonine protein kinase